MDQNEKLITGTLNIDPAANARPLTNAAKAALQQGRPLYTEQDLFELGIRNALAPRDTKSLITTGNYLIDAATQGFKPGQVWLVGGSTNMGKSTWAVSVADVNLMRGKRVAIVSAEDAPDVFAERFIARRAGVNFYRLFNNMLTREERVKVEAVREAVTKSYVLVNCVNRPIIEDVLKERVEPILSEVDMFIFDYLGKFRSKTVKPDNRRLTINEVGNAIIGLIKEAGKTAVMLSQLTAEKGQLNRPPTRYDIRDSQDVVNMAEVVGLLYRPTEDVVSGPPELDVNGRKLQKQPDYEAGKSYLIVDKNKRGKRGAYQLDWNDHSECYNEQLDPELERFDQLHDELGASDWDARRQVQ